MIGKFHQPGVLQRIWDSFLETSRAVVAIHYDAPWARVQRVPARVASVNPAVGVWPDPSRART